MHTSRETAQSFSSQPVSVCFSWQQIVFTNCFGISEAQVFDPRVLAEFDCLHDSNSITRKPAGSRHLPRKKKKKKHAFFPQCAGIYSDLFVQLKSLWFVNYFTCSSLEGSDIIIVCVRRVFLLINFSFEEVEIDLLFCCSGTSTERTPPCRMPRQNSVSFFFFFFLSALLDHQTVYHLLRRSKSWNFAHEFAYFFARLSN